MAPSMNEKHIKDREPKVDRSSPMPLSHHVSQLPDLEDRTETGHKPFQPCFRDSASYNKQNGDGWDAARECELLFYTRWEQFRDQPPPIYRG
ncbi:MAG: hypothetical protein V1740_05560 [Candidatus Woesearchaeota archaeon]